MNLKLVMLAAFTLLAVVSCAKAPPETPVEHAETAMVKKATPILFVDDVQQSIDFFADTLDFAKTMEVPYDRGLQFAAVEANGVEIMFQAGDIDDPTFTKEELAARVGQGFLYFEVENLDKVLKNIQGAEIVKDLHTTGYGSKEIYIREPGGNILGFAQHGVG